MDGWSATSARAGSGSRSSGAARITAMARDGWGSPGCAGCTAPDAELFGRMLHQSHQKAEVCEAAEPGLPGRLLASHPLDIAPHHLQPPEARVTEWRCNTVDRGLRRTGLCGLRRVHVPAERSTTVRRTQKLNISESILKVPICTSRYNRT